MIQLCITGSSFGQGDFKPVITDNLFPANSAALTGFAGAKLDASYKNRILAQDVNQLVEPFRHRNEDQCYQNEFWGKWFTSAVLAYSYRPEPKLKSILDQAVSGLLSTQTPDGYIGNYAKDKQLEGWDIWGTKYCMLGLLSYYDLTGDKNILIATCKLADYFIKELANKKTSIVKLGKYHGMASTSVLEPFCQLYSRTGEKRYLDLANEIVRQWEIPEGPQLISKSGVDVALRFPKPKNWFSPEQGLKAYEMLSCYEGLLELYRLTGKQEYRDVVERIWQNIRDNEINITGSGSSMECWFGGKQLQTMHIDRYQETCVTATWIKLSQQLLRLTGEAKYADAIEQSWYNALLGAMFLDGADWAKYSPLAGQRLQGPDVCGMVGLNCCVASGPRGLFTFPLTAVMSNKDGISVNFFAEGSYHLELAGGKQVEVIQQTDYPVSGNITIKVIPAEEKLLKLRIRIPQWSQNSTITINGQPVENVISGKYAEISRVWKPGDLVKLTVEMRGQIVRMGNLPEQIAIVRGPIVLSRDARLGKPDVDETIKPMIDKGGFVDLEPAGINQNGIWMKFKSPFTIETHQEGGTIKPTEITLCDFASAGNTLDDNSWFRVWLPQSFDPRK